MFIIQPGSEAHRRIAEAFAKPQEPRKISLAHREGKVSIKIGEGMWSPPLDVEEI